MIEKERQVGLIMIIIYFGTERKEVALVKERLSEMSRIKFIYFNTFISKFSNQSARNNVSL